MNDLLRGLALLPMVLGCHAAPSGLAPEGAASAPERLPSSLEALGRRAVGQRVPLQDAVLFIPDGVRLDAASSVPLSVHFQGGAPIAEENFIRSDRGGVLIASTLAGFSSAFSRPYRNPEAFRALLRSGERAASEIAGREIRFDPVTITFFSAGYGAVRELLKDPGLFERIDTLVSADSIYADVVTDEVRAPEVSDMLDFLRFAQAAARGEKVFVVAHGEFQTPYASTAECADFLLASVGGARSPSDGFTERGVPIAQEFHVGGFHLYSFAEATAGIHVDCLYMIPEWIRRHAPR